MAEFHQETCSCGPCCAFARIQCVPRILPLILMLCSAVVRPCAWAVAEPLPEPMIYDVDVAYREILATHLRMLSRYPHS